MGNLPVTKIWDILYKKSNSCGGKNDGVNINSKLIQTYRGFPL